MENTEMTLDHRCAEAVAKTEKCIRENPKEAAITSLIAGFLLAQLPLRLVAGTLMRLLVLMLRPAAIFYGLYRMAEDCQCRKHAQDWTPGEAEG